MEKVLKILTWNCNGAFRKKYEFVEKMDADILVIQECENPELAKDNRYSTWAKNYLWIGEIKHKGLGIFAKEGILITDLKWEDNGLKYFIACRINNEFNLIAVWTQRNNSVTYRYIGQFWKYLQINREEMGNCIILGDFNSNRIWDKKHRSCNHSDVVNELDILGVRSLYHEFHNVLQGEETHPTLFLQKNTMKPYHIDYIFASKDLVPEIISAEIGAHEYWLKLSDHMPFFASLDLTNVSL